jgi:hypothetical protein
MGPPKFSTLLFLHARRSDPDRPSEISPCPYLRAMFVFSVLCLVSRQCHSISPIVSTLDSSVLASSKITLSPSALLSLTRLKSLQGGASPLWPTRFSVYASPLLFTFATVSLPLATLSARGATLDTGGWLALTRDHPDPSPDRDLHPARSAKLRLAHITVGRPVTRPPPYRSPHAELPHGAPQSYSLRTVGDIVLLLRSCGICVVSGV